MENQIKKIMRKATLIQAEKGVEKLNVNQRNLTDFLGQPTFSTEELYKNPIPGVTLGLALYLLAVDKAVKKGIGMTGELTLTGKVLPIGGVREKTIAARRVRVFELIFPTENRKGFDELPGYLKEGINAHFVETFDDMRKIFPTHKAR